MRHARDLTGASPLDGVQGLSPLAALLVAVLRGWNRGGPGQAFEVLSARMRPAQAHAAMAALCDLAGVLGAHRRRPPACPAPPEAAFARFVERAALGTRKDAHDLARGFVCVSAVPALSDAAARLGLQLYLATLGETRPH
ncbi:MAG: hypothetical protein CMN17_03900 [Roseovarius sp.]|nr:hypothetical protein [Roseovarius sp.]|tara:strand:+ start:542 stop:961 length:420 start_codon:yes stop_codon:yes gene_type:complete